MDLKIRFRQVVRRGQLDITIARYVLRHPELLPRMPLPGAQGVHRKFNLRQAMKLALCSHFIKAGVWPPNAARATILTEELIRRWPSSKPDHRGRLYMSSLNDPWTARVANGRYYRLWRDQLAEKDDFFDGDVHTDLADGGETTDFFVLGSVEINLTLLEGKLSGIDR